MRKPTKYELNNRDDREESEAVGDESLPEVLLNTAAKVFLFNGYFM